MIQVERCTNSRNCDTTGNDFQKKSQLPLHWSAGLKKVHTGPARPGKWDGPTTSPLTSRPGEKPAQCRKSAPTPTPNHRGPALGWRLQLPLQPGPHCVQPSRVGAVHPAQPQGRGRGAQSRAWFLWGPSANSGPATRCHPPLHLGLQPMTGPGQQPPELHGWPSGQGQAGAGMGASKQIKEESESEPLVTGGPCWA